MIRRVKFFIFVSGCLTQIFSFSYNCNEIAVASVDLSDGPYNTLWYELNCCLQGRALTRDFMMLILRSQRPCYLTGAGFFPVTLDTLKSVNNSNLTSIISLDPTHLHFQLSGDDHGFFIFNFDSTKCRSVRGSMIEE